MFVIIIFYRVLDDDDIEEIDLSKGKDDFER